MRFVCRNQTCQKQFATKFNRNKHQRIKGHFEESKQATCKVPHDPSTNLCFCPRIDCKTTSKYKQNILKHLKSCSQVNLNKATAKENGTCGICNKTFTKKSDRYRHIQSVHHDDIDDNVDGNDVYDDLIIEDEAFPSMAFRNSLSWISLKTCHCGQKTRCNQLTFLGSSLRCIAPLLNQQRIAIIIILVTTQSAIPFLLMLS